MAKRGRPPLIIDEALLKKVEGLAAQGLTKTEIALSIGIHIGTLHKKKAENDDLNEAIKRGEAKGIATIANALFIAAKGGHVVAQIFFLKNRSPENWKDRHYIDETVRNVGFDADVKKSMEPQEAADAYADTLREGRTGNVVPIKRRK